MTRGGVHNTPEGYRIRFLPLGPTYRNWSRVGLLKRSPDGRYITGLINGASIIGDLKRAASIDRIDVRALEEYCPSRYDLLSRRLTVPFVAIDQGEAA
jgi:hypothetical protein